MENDQPPARLRRLAHPLRALGFLLVTAVVGVVAFALGTLVRSPDAAVLDARGQSLPVYALIEQRVVSDETRIQGEAAAATTAQIYVDPPENTALAVVTSVEAEPGSDLSNGAFIGTVSDRPLFVFALEVPLFRDLREGDRGSDVASLQVALGVGVSGEVDSATLEAIRALYAAAGIEAPRSQHSGVPVRLSEFFSVQSTAELRLASIAPRGTQLAGDVPFASIETGDPFVSVRASAREASEIEVGDAVTIQRADEEDVVGIVAEIGEFDPTGNAAGRPPGRDIRVDVPTSQMFSPGEPVSVRFGAEASPGMAVPTLAIRSDSAGAYVLTGDEGTDPERVSVRVMQSAQGWSAIEAPELGIGRRVLVSG